MLKLAYLETLRHSPPVLSAERFALREVERFGRLIPEGAKLICSAAAANRDPQIFKNPEEFKVDRRDMCQREPRGQYRADGLASGIAFALGKPSIHPAVPEDRPRSRYAIIRDAAVSASQILIDSTKDIKLKKVKLHIYRASPSERCTPVGSCPLNFKLDKTIRSNLCPRKLSSMGLK